MPRFLILLVGLAQSLHALTIEIDYRYDTSGFFDVPERRDAIESVADFYSEIITDRLLQIDPAEFPGASWTATFFNPASGAQTMINNLVVPEDTILVFVGARALSGTTLGQAAPGGFSAGGSSAWIRRLRGRGNPGAESSSSSSRTDFAPWGGSIVFDSPRSWNFKQDNDTGFEFITVALHEMGHVLGIGTAPVWDNLITNNEFRGEAVIRSYNEVRPEAFEGHFQGDSLRSRRFGSLGTAHGAFRDVLMRPTLSDDNATLSVCTDLDLAALVDLGWELDPPFNFRFNQLSPDGSQFSFNSVSFKSYTLYRAADLNLGFDTEVRVVNGTGGIRTAADSLPPAERAFYRMVSFDVFAAESHASTASLFADSVDGDDGYEIAYEPPVPPIECRSADPHAHCDASSCK